MGAITTTAVVVGLTRSQGYIRMEAGQSSARYQLTRCTNCPKTSHSSKVKKNWQLLSSNWFFSLGFIEKMLLAIFVSPLHATEYRRKMVVVVGEVIKYRRVYWTLNFHESEVHQFNFSYSNN